MLNAFHAAYSRTPTNLASPKAHHLHVRNDSCGQNQLPDLKHFYTPIYKRTHLAKHTHLHSLTSLYTDTYTPMHSHTQAYT